MDICLFINGWNLIFVQPFHCQHNSDRYSKPWF